MISINTFALVHAIYLSYKYVDVISSYFEYKTISFGS